DGIRDRTVTGVQTCALPISHQRRAKMIGTISTAIAITSFATLRAGSTPTVTTLAHRTSTLTAAGKRFPTTVRFGFRQPVRTGRHTTPGAGFGSRITDGLGFLMSPGVGRRITTDAGSSMPDRGPG